MGLHVKSFIPARRDPTFVLSVSCFEGTKFSHVIASGDLQSKSMDWFLYDNGLRYERAKQDEKVNST